MFQPRNYVVWFSQSKLKTLNGALAILRMTYLNRALPWLHPIIHHMFVAACQVSLRPSFLKSNMPLLSKVLLTSFERCSHTAVQTNRDTGIKCLLTNSNLLQFSQQMKWNLHLSTNLRKTTKKILSMSSCAFLTYLFAKINKFKDTLVICWLIYTKGQGNQVEEHILQTKEYLMSLHHNSKISLNLMILNKYMKDYI